MSLHLLDRLALIDSHPGDDEHDECAFRHRQRVVASMGWYAHELERLVGFLRVLPVSFLGRRFDVDVQGAEDKLAVVLGVLGDREEMVDAVAWPVDCPGAWATYGSRLPALGWVALRDHPANSDVPSLRVHRTPLGWLRSGGDGIAPLDLAAAASEIRAAMERGGRIKPENDAHAAEIAAALTALTDLRHLVVDHQEAA